MKSLSAILAIAFALAAQPALAQKIDLSDLSCKQFTAYNKENTGIILMWLDGYYRSKDDAAVIDFDRMGKNGAKLASYCADNPDTSVGKAAEKVMGQ